MRFIVSSAALNARLQTLSKIINPKNSMQIMDCFLFNVRGQQLVITASDQENYVVSQIPVEEADSEGKFAIVSRNILEAMKELPDQPLTFEVDMEHFAVTIRYQNGQYHFTAQDGDEYPDTPHIEGDCNVFTITGQKLVAGINRSLFATAVDNSHPAMTGVYFDLTPDWLAIVTCDGHKLVRTRLFDIKSDSPASFILPKKPATALRSILGSEGGDVVVKFTKQSAELTFGDGVVFCRLIDSAFPNYNAVIADDNPNIMEADRKSLISALRRVTPFASESSQLIRLSLTTDQIEISSEDPDFARSAKEVMTCEYGGQTLSIGFRGQTLSDALNNLDSDRVQFELADASRPGIIKPVENEEGQDVLMLIMPMLLNE